MARKKCGNCGRTGHNARTCTNKKKRSTLKRKTATKKATKRTTTKRKCGNCGRTGHNARTCTNKKKRVAKKRVTKKRVTKKRVAKKRVAKKVTTKKRATKRKPVAKKRSMREDIDKDDIPDKWPAKYNDIYEYALRLGRRYANYKPRGQGSPYRKPELAIDPYHEVLYVRFVDVGPGVGGMSLWGHNILQQQRFEVRMSTIDAAAIGKAVHEATGIRVDVDSTKRNDPKGWGFKDRNRVVFEAKPKPQRSRRSYGRGES